MTQLLELSPVVAVISLCCKWLPDMTHLLFADITICIHRQVQHRSEWHSCQGYLQLSQWLSHACLALSDVTQSLFADIINCIHRHGAVGIWVTQLLGLSQIILTGDACLVACCRQHANTVTSWSVLNTSKITSPSDDKAWISPLWASVTIIYTRSKSV